LGTSHQATGRRQTNQKPQHNWNWYDIIQLTNINIGDQGDNGLEGAQGRKGRRGDVGEVGDRGERGM